MLGAVAAWPAHAHQKVEASTSWNIYLADKIFNFSSGSHQPEFVYDPQDFMLTVNLKIVNITYGKHTHVHTHLWVPSHEIWAVHSHGSLNVALKKNEESLTKFLYVESYISSDGHYNFRGVFPQKSISIQQHT